MTSRLLTADVAARVGLQAATIRRYRVRGTFPEPDGHTLRHPWWHAETVERWMATRRKYERRTECVVHEEPPRRTRGWRDNERMEG